MGYLATQTRTAGEIQTAATVEDKPASPFLVFVAGMALGAIIFTIPTVVYAAGRRG